jgi:hypothetical protein
MNIQTAWGAVGVVLGILTSDLALAHSFTQSLGGYSDNSGRTGRQVGVQGALDFAETDAVQFSADRSQTFDPDVVEDQFSRDVYGTGASKVDSFSLSATRTFAKLTDLTLSGSGAFREGGRSTGGGINVSHWFFHETFRAGLDVSRTFVNQPALAFLDYDSELITPKTETTSSAATVTLRHLATPTTITEYALGRVLRTDRPAEARYRVMVRQYVPKIKAAVEGQVERIFNRGTITTENAYGSVDGWIGAASYTQNLSRLNRARFAYRYYREDEETRAYKDHLIRGADSYSLYLSHDFARSRGAGIQAGVVRYVANDGLSAAAVDFGVTVQM